MTKKLAWNLFKETGSVDVFLGMKNLENMGNLEASKYENNKNEWNNNSRETNGRF